MNKKKEYLQAKERLFNAISENSRKTISEFEMFGFAEGYSYSRLEKYFTCFKSLFKGINKDCMEFTEKDIYAMLKDIETREYSEWTKYSYKGCLKKLCKWMHEKKGARDYYRIVKPSTNKKKASRKLPEELLTMDEVMGMVKAAGNPRDKALIMTLYETGARIGEIMSLKMKHVAFDDEFASVMLTGKTGMRIVAVVYSAPYLAEWLRYREGELESPLWVNVKGECMEYANMRKMFKQAAKKAGIGKRVYPHLFRHSQATSMATKFTEPELRAYFGWERGSNMVATYVHLSGREVNDKILRLHGIAKPDSGAMQTPKKCMRCFTVNPLDAEFCVRCRYPLAEESALKVVKQDSRANRLLNRLLQDERFRELFSEMAREGGLNV